MPTISATWDVEVRGSQSKASLSKSERLYLKNKLKVKGLGDVASVIEQTCLERMRYVFNSQYLQ
jgi:hypothetical protein